MDRECKGIFIPIELWENKDLSWNEKIVLLEIDSMTSKGHDCFISDEYVASLIGCSISTAKRIMSNLIQGGYVRKTRFDGRCRFVESCMTFGFERADSSKLSEQIAQNEPVINNILFPPILEDNKLSSNSSPQEKSEPISKKFVRPTWDELLNYCHEKNLLYLDIDEFIDFYESKGWKVGSSPMKDWKAAARRWNRQNAQRPGAKPALNIKNNEEAPRWDKPLYTFQELKERELKRNEEEKARLLASLNK